jgi:hypothetical protein
MIYKLNIPNKKEFEKILTQYYEVAGDESVEQFGLSVEEVCSENPNTFFKTKDELDAKFAGFLKTVILMYQVKVAEIEKNIEDGDIAIS